MRQFYRVYEYSRMFDVSNPVFFHDRENAIAYFLTLAKKADVLACDIVKNEHGYMSAFGLERTINLEPINFED
jgi:hypothetical protein